MQLDHRQGRESADNRDRGWCVRRYPLHHSASVDNERLTIDYHKLAGKVLDCADSVVAVCQHLTDRGVAIEMSVHEGVQRPGLECHVLHRGITPEGPSVHRPNMQGAQQPIIDDVTGHHRNLTQVARILHSNDVCLRIALEVQVQT